ncbi:MAG: hypothetical protein ACLR5S_04920 [Ruminococcus sp.]
MPLSTLPPVQRRCGITYQAPENGDLSGIKDHGCGITDVAWRCSRCLPLRWRKNVPGWACRHGKLKGKPQKANDHAVLATGEVTAPVPKHLGLRIFANRFRNRGIE